MRSRDELRALSEHVLYEVEMLFQVANRLRAHTDDTERLPWELENACIESFALHCRVLIDFVWKDPDPQGRFPDDAFAADFLHPGVWAEIRERIQQSKLDGVAQRTGAEVAHLSYKRTQLPPEARRWQFDVIAAVVGRAFTLFLENVSPELVADGFAQRMRKAWPTYLNGRVAISYPPVQNPRSVATTTSQAMATIVMIEDLLTRPEDGKPSTNPEDR